MEMNPLVERENFLESLNDDIIIETGHIVEIFNEGLGAGNYEIVVVVVVVVIDNILDILVTSVDSNINTTLSLSDVILEINDKSFESELVITRIYNLPEHNSSA